MTYIEALTALGDGTRRQVFERLKAGPMAVGVIARGMPVSRPAISQHLKVLKEAGLVTERREGTTHLYSVDPTGIIAIRGWLDEFWDQTLAAFKAEVELDETSRNRKKR
jgi:DNA-binding transcriptional ArsR family regulator